MTSFGSALFVLFSVYTGITLYAKYQDCDPLVSEVSEDFTTYQYNRNIS
jgi:hypothetical protein